MEKFKKNGVFSDLRLRIEMDMLNYSSRKYICHHFTLLSVAIIENKLLYKGVIAKNFNIFLSNRISTLYEFLQNGAKLKKRRFSFFPCLHHEIVVQKELVPIVLEFFHSCLALK